MERTVNVKGTGRISVPPDQIVIPMTLNAADPAYEKTMETAAAQLEALRAALLPLGFAKEDIKTNSFQVNTNYESRQDDKGHWQQVFVGYLCTQTCTITFDLDIPRLSEIVNALAGCSAVPEFHISFTVRDPEAVRSALLEDAARNAREKAEVLCRAVGVTLGMLQRIDYNWGEVVLESASDVMLGAGMPMAKRAVAMDFQPEDIHVEDTVSFVWSIQ